MRRRDRSQRTHRPGGSSKFERLADSQQREVLLGLGRAGTARKIQVSALIKQHPFGMKARDALNGFAGKVLVHLLGCYSAVL